MRKKRVRMTSRAKPPTAAVTITRTCLWSDTILEASGEQREGMRGVSGDYEGVLMKIMEIC